MSNFFLQISFPLYLEKNFDYKPLANTAINDYVTGMRVICPFGKQKKLGIITGINTQTNIALNKLKNICVVLDKKNICGEELWQLICWASSYYHYPLGAVIFSILPEFLTKKNDTIIAQKLTLSQPLCQILQQKLSIKQQKCIKLFTHKKYISILELFAQAIHWNTIKSLLNKNYLHETNISPPKISNFSQNVDVNFVLSSEQQQVINNIKKTYNSFKVNLLYGITGSGKTEVYLQTMIDVLQQNKQVLFLVPEIGLLPQTAQRIKQRFNAEIILYSSNESQNYKNICWLQAQNGQAQIIIGTRSAIFLPTKNLGLIIIDEEHDSSYRQQSNFLYSARDVAIMRAKKLNIPLILGSATPSLTSIYNLKQPHYQLLKLTSRPNNWQLAKFSLMECKYNNIHQQLSFALRKKILLHLEKKQQVMFFINRRGYAPITKCFECEKIIECPRCDIPLTYHFAKDKLRCHRCNWQLNNVNKCPYCHSMAINNVGHGTEKLELFLMQIFNKYKILRIDRDTVNKKSLADKLNSIQTGNVDLLIGTQMLSKGHHFSKLSLVIIFNADDALHTEDFRATERLSQLITQVAGRAGREIHDSEVVLLTKEPQHKLWQLLQKQDFMQTANYLLQLRKKCNLTPYCNHINIIAEAKQANVAINFLNQVNSLIKVNLSDDINIEIFGPTIATLAKKANYYRFEIMISAKMRLHLHKILQRIFAEITQIKQTQSLRWVIEVDPTT